MEMGVGTLVFLFANNKWMKMIEKRFCELLQWIGIVSSLIEAISSID